MKDPGKVDVDVDEDVAPWPRALRDELETWSHRQGHREQALRRFEATVRAPRRARASRGFAWALVVAATAGATVVAFVNQRSTPVPPRSEVAADPPRAQSGAASPHARAVGGVIETRTFADGARISVSPGAAMHVLSAPPAGARVRLDAGGIEAHLPPRADSPWVIEAGPYAIEDRHGGRLQIVWDRRNETLSVTLGAGAVTVSGGCLKGTRLIGSDEHARIRCGDARAPVALAASTSASAVRRSDEPAAQPGRMAQALVAGGSDLVAHYRFDDDADTGRAEDASGLGNHARIDGAKLGAGALPTEGAGGALVPRADVGVVEPSSSLNALGRALTVAAWVFRDADGLSFEMIVSRQAGLTGGEHFGLGCFQNQLVFLVETTPPEITIMDWGLIPNDEWVHVAATYDGATAILYLGGVEVARRALDRKLSGGETPLLLGANANGPNRVVTEQWHGRIDDVRIYRRALGPAEIAEIARRTP